MALKDITKLFVVTVPDEKDNQTKPQVNIPIQKDSFTTATAQPDIAGYAAPTAIDTAQSSEEIVGTILDTLIAKNLPGPDYLELKNNASALGKTLAGLPENQILEASFNVLRNQYPELTKATILKSIDKYIEFVEEERKAGIAQSAAKRENTVGEKLRRVAQLKEDAKTLAAQIEEAKRKLDSTNSTIAGLEGTINSEEEKLRQKEQVFISSVEQVVKILTDDKTKISTLNI